MRIKTTLLTGMAVLALTPGAHAASIYWADAGTNKIQRANLDGSNVTDLVTGLSTPYGIALDLSSAPVVVPLPSP